MWRKHGREKVPLICPRRQPLVNQYMWPVKDSNQYMCYNGISHPIYDCEGNISYSLPLHMYPPVNEIHPQVLMTHRILLNDRPELQRRREAAARGEIPASEIIPSYDRFSDGMYLQHSMNYPISGCRK